MTSDNHDTTEESWDRLYAAVYPEADPHPIPGWELGEFAARIVQILNMPGLRNEYYARATALGEFPSVARHLSDGCASCMEEMALLMEQLQPA